MPITIRLDSYKHYKMCADPTDSQYVQVFEFAEDCSLMDGGDLSDLPPGTLIARFKRNERVEFLTSVGLGKVPTSLLSDKIICGDDFCHGLSVHLLDGYP